MTFTFGVDYYPEHWPEERWPIDARLMQDAGINFVRLSEFAWSRLEPSEGQFSFDWLERAIDVLGAHGIRVMLGTPTASAPPWVVADDDRYFLKRQNGQTLTYGSRRDYCPNNPTYRARSARIIQAMAAHFANNPHVMGWQIDNEFGERCFCDTCRAAFATWLQKKYGTLEALNKTWGTVFWSHEYTDWSQIPAALYTVHALHNPSLELDYYRFMSDTYVDFQQQQIDILRGHCPDAPITHNFMGFRYDNLNYFDLARPLDFVSWDNYPRGFWINDREIDPAVIALEHETMRALKNKPFWVMESHSGPAGWGHIGLTPRPGEIRLWAYQAIAHGADGIVFFRWRSCRFGAEQYWHGVIDHDGKPRRRYDEVKQMGHELKQIGEQIAGTPKPADVAIMLSYDSRFAFQIQANNAQFSYPEHLRAYFKALHRHGVNAHIVSPASDLSTYSMVIVPALYVVDAPLAEKLRAYAENGGHVVLTARSGVKDEHNIIPEMTLPARLSSLAGVEVVDYDSLLASMQVPVQFSDGQMAMATVWCDVLLPATATIMATYNGEFYAGQPAITRNQVGRGTVDYVGVLGGDALIEMTLSNVLSLAGIVSSFNGQPGIEVVKRGNLTFVLNHGANDLTVTLNEHKTDLITEKYFNNEVVLGSGDVIVLI